MNNKRLNEISVVWLYGSGNHTLKGTVACTNTYPSLKIRGELEYG